jgi:hypothetical protein
MLKKYDQFLKLLENVYLSDKDIASQYDDFEVIDFMVSSIREDGGASGWIDINFNSSDEENSYYTISDSWIKYDSGPRIAFDHWYPEEVNNKLKSYIERELKKEILKRETDKYNL